MSDTDQIRILVVGLEDFARELLAEELAKCEVITVKEESGEFDPEPLLEPLDPLPHMFVCGPQTGEVDAIELAQLMSNTYPGAPIFYACTARDGFDAKILRKNGYSDVFLLPVDVVALRTAVAEATRRAAGKTVWRAVRLIDIEAGEELSFDTALYMPKNDKYVKLTNSGSSLTEDQVERLQKHRVANMQVPQEHLQGFYDYTAKKLSEMGKDDSLSETERQERKLSAIRDLIGGIFTDSDKEATFGAGKAILSDCQNIVKSYIVQDGNKEQADWYTRLLEVSGQFSGDMYSHASATSTYAALFSMALGIGDPNLLAIAGLLHDLGLADVPQEIQSKNPEEWTPEEKRVYELHPQYSVDMIKKRKINVDELVQKMILQHHERWCGQGFPNGLRGQKIKPEAQLLALADVFDEMTSEKAGQAKVSPADALKKLRQDLANDPTNAEFDPELLGRMLKIFPEASSGGELSANEDASLRSIGDNSSSNGESASGSNEESSDESDSSESKAS